MVGRLLVVGRLPHPVLTAVRKACFLLLTPSIPTPPSALPPAPGKEFNFTNGMGMSYEAKHVRECLQKGKHVENRGGRMGG